MDKEVRKDMLHNIKDMASKMILVIQDIERIERNIKDLRQDVEKIQLSTEEFFNDFIKEDKGVKL